MYVFMKKRERGERGTNTLKVRRRYQIQFEFPARFRSRPDLEYHRFSRQRNARTSPTSGTSRPSTDLDTSVDRRPSSACRRRTRKPSTVAAPCVCRGGDAAPPIFAHPTLYTHFRHRPPNADDPRHSPIDTPPPSTTTTFASDHPTPTTLGRHSPIDTRRSTLRRLGPPTPPADLRHLERAATDDAETQYGFDPIWEGGRPSPPNKHSPPSFRPRDPSDLDTNPSNPSLPPLTDPATNYSGLSEIHDRTALVERTPTPPTALHHPNSPTDDIQWNGWSRDDTRHCVPRPPGGFRQKCRAPPHTQLGRPRVCHHVMRPVGHVTSPSSILTKLGRSTDEYLNEMTT